MNKKQVLKIVDKCFHAHASNYRHEAKELATKMIDELKRIQDENKQIITIQPNPLFVKFKGCFNCKHVNVEPIIEPCFLCFSNNKHELK